HVVSLVVPLGKVDPLVPLQRAAGARAGGHVQAARWRIDAAGIDRFGDLRDHHRLRRYADRPGADARPAVTPGDQIDVARADVAGVPAVTARADLPGQGIGNEGIVDLAGPQPGRGSLMVAATGAAEDVPALDVGLKLNVPVPVDPLGLRHVVERKRLVVIL